MRAAAFVSRAVSAGGKRGSALRATSLIAAWCAAANRRPRPRCGGFGGKRLREKTEGCFHSAFSVQSAENRVGGPLQYVFTS